MTSRSPGLPAPELRISAWIDARGAAMAGSVRLADLGSGYRILYCFQHWCEGCHARGFPTLAVLHDRLRERDVGFAAIQTVFEGHETNTFDKLRINQERYGLAMPFGHDPSPGPDRLSPFMEDYRTGGTPWFTVIDPQGNIVYAGFELDAERLTGAL